jgi:glycosyltransferase involved in cell wall biosynthesis
MQDRRLNVIVSCSGKFHAFSLAEQLQRHGALCMLFSSYSSIKNPLMSRFVKRLDKEGVPPNRIVTNLCMAIGIKFFNDPFYWNNLFDKWVARKVKKSSATIFIGWSGMALHSIRAAKRKGMLVILERGSSHIVIQNELLKKEYQYFGRKFEIDPRVIEKEFKEYIEADYISIPSDFVLDSFLKKGIPSHKLLKNNYGSVFKSVEKFKKKDSKFRLLYLGTSKIRKGLIYFYEALNALNISQDDYEVWFVGSVDKELESTIDKLKQNNWIFHGKVAQQELPKYISQCDIAIHPSIEEGLSMVIPQMMSCGIPVIATTNTGGADLIEDGVNGFIVPIRSSQKISEKIEFLYRNPESLSSMKEAAKNLKDFSWDAYGVRYLQNLNQIK